MQNYEWPRKSDVRKFTREPYVPPNKQPSNVTTWCFYCEKRVSLRNHNHGKPAVR